ncbi:MAG: MDR family MFS transporter, partial [Chloroflexota bacterium]
MRTTAPPPPSEAYTQPPDWQGISRKRLYFAIAGLQLALLLAALDQTIVGTAMPRIVADLNGFEHYAWATTAYMLCSTAVVPIVGKLSDMYGRKIFLTGGTIFFVLSSVLCGLAQDMLQLAVLRGLQGIGGGILMSSIFTAISILFPPAQRGKIQGVFSAVFGLASIIGPLLGGFLTDTFSWRWIFLVNVPVGLAALAVLWFAFPDWRPERRGHSIDYLGSVTLVGGIVPLLLALTWGGREFAWTSPQVGGMIVFSLVMLTIFVAIERRASEPIIPLGMLRNPAILSPLLSLVFMSAGMFGTVLFVPLFIQSVVGSSATESGTALMPMMMAVVISSIVCGSMISRTGRYKWAGLLGLGLSAAGLFLLSGMGPGTTYFTVLRNMLVVGTGMGICMPVYTLAAQNAVTMAEIGVATGLTQF